MTSHGVDCNLLCYDVIIKFVVRVVKSVSGQPSIVLKKQILPVAWTEVFSVSVHCC